jgi:hypothetical protein
MQGDSANRPSRRTVVSGSNHRTACLRPSHPAKTIALRVISEDRADANRRWHRTIVVN